MPIQERGMRMTTGLIGIPGTVAMRARIAVVGQQNARELADLLQFGGHDHGCFPRWSEFAAACEEGAAWDFVFYDDSVADSVPEGIDVPGLLISEQESKVGFAAIAETLEPLASLAVQLRSEQLRSRDYEQFVEGITTGEVLAGRCPVMRRLQSTISRAAGSEATVLIEGPPGSGKSLAACMIHCRSRRSGKPMRTLDCAEAEAQTVSDLLATASETTVVFEDIDRLPAQAQSVLVKHLKERSGPRGVAAPRIVATTSAYLPELIARGVVREDLYYRLNAFPMVMPALREHMEDLTEIAETILHLICAQSGRASSGFTPLALVLLESMQWPGNVTQLEAVVKRAHVLAAGGPIDREHVVASSAETKTMTGAQPTAPANDRDLDREVSEDEIRSFEEEEQYLLSRALRATKGNVRRAAQLLGIGRATLYRKIQQYNLRLQ